MSVAAQACPQCGRPGGLDPGAGPEQVHCPGCGLVLTAELRRELAYVDSVQEWATARRTALLAGTVPLAPAAQPVASVGPTSGSPVTAAGALLATGAFALVVAGLAFTAVAWEFLGALGQLLVLVVVGLLALLAGRQLASRIPGTATALAVTGAALLVVAAGFLLSSPDAGPPWARAAAVALAGIGGVLGAGRQARRQPAAGAFSASVAGVLAVVALAFAPMLEPWTATRAGLLWASAVLVFGGAAVALLSRVRGDLIPARAPWAALGSATAVVGVCIAAGVAAERVDGARLWPPAVAGIVLALGALLLLVLDRLLAARRWAPPVAALALESFAGFLVLATFLIGDRPAQLAAVAGVWCVVAAATVAHLASWRPATADAPRAGWVLLTSVLLRTVAVSSGATVAALVAAIRSGADAWPGVVGGLVVGIAGVALVAAWVLVVRRVTTGVDLPLLAAAAVGLVWTGLTEMAGASLGSGADPRAAVGMAWLVLGVGVLAVLVAARWEPMTYWFAGAAAALGTGLLFPTDRAPSALTPWLVGLVLAAPLVLAAVAVSRRGGSRSSLLAAPGLALLLAPPVLGVLADSLSGAYGDGSDDVVEVARLASAALVATVVTVVGARWHLAGPLWVGLVAVIVVVLAQLVTWASIFPQWLVLTVVGAVLVLVGARWEWVRARGRRTRAWAAQLR